MIKKFIDKLLGKGPKSGADKGGRAVSAGRRVEVPQSEHPIDPKLVDERAVKVVVSADQTVARVNGKWLITAAISATPGLGE